MTRTLLNPSTNVDPPTRAFFNGVLVHRDGDALKHSSVASDDGLGGFGPPEWCRVVILAGQIGIDMLA
jgi:hypothetical protein